MSEVEADSQFDHSPAAKCCVRSICGVLYERPGEVYYGRLEIKISEIAKCF